MTNATIGATIVTDLITGAPNAWAECYDPARHRVRAAPKYAKENLNVAEQYVAWFTPGDVEDVARIAPGSGAVIRRGIHKLAVYKAPDETITQCSAVCPHLHCIVGWNDIEKTWDCPCHGSRFDPYGRVVNGPAVEDLKSIPDEAAAS
jgi:Rieske Fe-S protein